MATFWTWGLRNPCAVVAVLALASGFTGVLDWSAAMMLTMVMVVVGDSAHHLGSRARQRRRRDREAAEAIKAAIELRKRFVDTEVAAARRAA